MTILSVKLSCNGINDWNKHKFVSLILSLNSLMYSTLSPYPTSSHYLTWQFHETFHLDIPNKDVPIVVKELLLLVSDMRIKMVLEMI